MRTCALIMLILSAGCNKLYQTGRTEHAASPIPLDSLPDRRTRGHGRSFTRRMPMRAVFELTMLYASAGRSNCRRCLNDLGLPLGYCSELIEASNFAASSLPAISFVSISLLIFLYFLKSPCTS